MKHSHKMPAMRALPYTTHFSHSLMVKAKNGNKHTKNEKQSKQTNTQKNVNKMYIIEIPSFTDRVGLVYLAVTCYFFIHSS